MQLKVSTGVRSSLQKVKEGFNEELFVSLNPPFPKVKLLQFDGCERGDRVAIALDFVLFKQNWISDIVDSQHSTSSWSFVDVGMELPFFLKKWRHEHLVVAHEEGAEIVDRIDFTSGFWVIDLFLYPVLKLQFFYRKPIYRKTFNKK